MSKTYTIRKAGENFAALVQELDKRPVIELTYRRKPVAVLMSVREYNRLRAPKTDFWEAYTAFRKRTKWKELKIDPEIWDNVRDPSPGREVKL